MTTPELPSWAASLRDRYLSGEASLFLLHGNVRDLQRHEAEDGTVSWVDLGTFLQRFLARSRDVVVSYDVSRGLRAADPAQERRLRSVVDARRLMAGQAALDDLPRTVPDVLPALEALVTDLTLRAGVVVDDFDLVAPRADPAFMTHDDKAALATLRRWSSDPAVLGTDNLVIFVCEQLSAVAPAVLASPQLVALRVPFPDLDARRAFLAAEAGGVPVDLPDGALAQVTAGLTLLQIRALLQVARQTGEPVRFETVSARKKAIIEQECHGLVELVAPRHDLSHVGGLDEVKGVLRRVAEAVVHGRHNQVPMGMIFVGPMGTGKTFVAQAFAAASGLTCLTLKNFRHHWVGSTEANLEKVLELVEALGYVLLIVDEADRALAGGGGDDGVGSRVIARLKEFMSDTSHRGRVVTLMMTNRPDKLDVDLKRPGRFDLKIPFFFPESTEERRAILAALARKNAVALADDVELAAVAEVTSGWSGAELEGLLLAATSRAGREERELVAQADLRAAADDVIPSRDVRMLEYMEMLAVFECSNRAMLPERFRGLDTGEVLDRLDALRAMLGRRAE
ncbi:MAG: ATP-binding protein [Alphaproteobacteria bacterium]|nr:ATP-binding protein [Alphaproteobacteria bacterium]